MPRSSAVQIYRVVKTADNKFEKKDYKKALEGYKKALKMGPNEEIESFCYLKIGICYQHLKKFHDSIASFDKSASISKNFESFFYKGVVLLQINMFDEAEDAFKQSLKLKEINNTQKFLSHLNLGRASFLKGKFKNALKFIKIAHSINKKDLTTLLLLAEVYSKLQNFEDSIKIFEQVLSIDVNNNDALLGIIGIILEDYNDQQRAISYLTSHLKKMKTPDANLFLLKGDIHFSLSDYENALINYRKAKKSNLNRALAREIRCLLQLNRSDDAIESLNDVLQNKNFKDKFTASLLLAEIYATKKEKEKATAILNDLINTNSEIIQNPKLSQAVANILLLNGEDDKAEEFFLNSINLGLKTWIIVKQLALIYVEKKDYKKAEEFLEISFKLANSTDEMGQSYHLNAIMVFNQKDFSKTIKICEKGIKEIKIKDQHFLLLQLLKAKSFLQLNDEKKAKNLITSLINNNPEIKNVVLNDSDLKGLI